MIERSLSSIVAISTRLGIVVAVALGCSKSGGSPTGPEPPPAIDVVASATSLAFGSAEIERIITLTNRGDEAVGWRGEVSSAWVVVIPSSGILPPGSGTVTVRVARQGLVPGNHTGQVRIVIGANSIPLDVTAEVTARPIAAIDHSSIELGPDDASATAMLTNAGNSPLTWSLNGPSWVVATPSSGTLASGAGQSITLAPNRSMLPAGAHTAILTLTSDGGTVTITLRVQVAAPPRLRLEPPSLDFGGTTTALDVIVANDGGRSLTWGATASAAWAHLSTTSGALVPGSSRTITVTVNRDGRPAGNYRATLSFTSDGGQGSIAVEMDVAEAPPPPPPPPTPPPPPPPSLVALAGQVVDQFTNAGIAGLTIQFDGIVGVTDLDGRFSVLGTPANSLRPLAISGISIHGRTTFARTSDTRWLAIPASFNMSAFDDMAREFEPRTIRWLTSPQIYIDTRPQGFAGGAELNQWIQEVQSVAGSFVSSWTNSAVNPTSVTVTSSPPPDGTPGTIVIHFNEDPSRYSSSQTVGLASTGWTFRREISSGTIWLRYSLVAGQAWARTAVIGHELGHTMGMGHMDGATPSIMTPRVSTSSLTTFDSAAGSIVYSRSPGNTSPDADNQSYYTGGLAPAGLPAGYFHWVCDAPGRSSDTYNRGSTRITP